MCIRDRYSPMPLRPRGEESPGLDRLLNGEHANSPQPQIILAARAGAGGDARRHAADGWRLVFLVNLPVGVGAYALSRRMLVESRQPGRRRLPDLPGALIFALAIASLVLGVVQGEDRGARPAPILACYAAAAALLALFARRCARHRSPLVDLTLFRSRTFAVANSATIFAAAGFYGLTSV